MPGRNSDLARLGERDEVDALAVELARARQGHAHDAGRAIGLVVPRWEGLTEQERAVLVQEARNWLRANLRNLAAYRDVMWARRPSRQSDGG